MIRVSGPSAHRAGIELLGKTPPVQQAKLSSISDPQSGELLDNGLALFFQGPASFTGEDVLELHCHGGLATVDAILTALGCIQGLRAAEPGEFSRRAFLNGKLDLTEIEGLADLISSQTEEQRRQALRQASGSLRKQYEQWREDLIRARALIEAELDFADEDDVLGSVSDAVWSGVQDLGRVVKKHLGDQNRGEIIRRGFRVALLGTPNSGKSSLLNALAQRDVAIVTPVKGTTRDVIEVSLNIGGYLVIVSDTAGIRETADLVEQEGIRRAQAVAVESDLVLWLHPADEPGPVRCPEDVAAKTVVTKSDLGESFEGSETLSINTVEEGGIDPLLSFLTQRFAEASDGLEEPVVTRQRHRQALVLVEGFLCDALMADKPLELRSEDLRLAADQLGRITGRIDVEDLLDVIFSEFCIGK